MTTALARSSFNRVLFALACAWSATTLAQAPTLDPAELQWLGERIFTNECNRRPECLTAWNDGEEFPSLGIGHFIWYRAGQQAPFAETFPDLIAFMQARGAQPPAWIGAGNVEQPWPDRAAFLAASAGPELTQLRDYLARHTDLQTAFIISRFDGALARLLAAAPAEEHEALTSRFNSIAAAAPPYGLYALIDYVHFKGEGTKSSERYANAGWGLLQVLRGMPLDSRTPLQDFVTSARAALATRVALAPAERNEQRWLNGWNARLDTYLPTGATRIEEGAAP